MAAARQVIWPDGRPARPDTKDWSCHGSLGWTLQQALDEMDHDLATTAAAGRDNLHDDQDHSHAKQGEHDKEDSSTANREEASPSDKNEAPLFATPSLQIKATPELRQSVLEALATAPERMKRAPHGILKGRIKYFQRQGARWRMEVDDVRIRRRFPLAKVRRTKERPSCWDLSRERTGKVEGDGTNASQQEADNTTKWSFELLAYNDTE